MFCFAIIYDFGVNKEKLKFASKQVLVFIAQLAFSRAWFGELCPLGFAFSLARIHLGAGLFLVTAEYAVSCLYFCADFYLMISLAFEIVILSLYYYFKNTTKIKRKRLFLCLFLILSTMVKLYYLVAGILDWKIYLAETILKLFAAGYFVMVYKLFQKKFVFLRCSNLDYLYFSSFVVLVVFGLFQYEFLAKTMGLFLVAAAVIFVCRVLPLDKFLIFALSVSLCFGFILSSSKFVVLAVLAVVLMTSISRLNKYLFLSVTLFMEYLILRLSAEMSLFNMLSLGLATVINACVPQKITNKLLEFFSDKSTNIIKENLLQERERDIRQNILTMSKTLNKMQEDFKFLIVGKIDRKLAAQELAKDLMYRCCESCEGKNICSKSLIDKVELLSEYIYYAIQKGSISDEEMSVGFKTYCGKVSTITREINARSKQFLEFETSVKTEDESKLLISTELGNFANLFQNFAKNIQNSPKINKNLSFLAKEILSNNMIEVQDVGVFESKLGIEKIDVVADNSVMTRRELSDGLASLVKSKVQVQKIKHLDFSGLSLVSFVVANNLRAEFAVAGSSKEMVSGDNTLIAKIDDNRFFVAIADGMGHGKLAGKTSKMVLELIKNLVFVGIDIEIIIDSVNKLLLPVGLDNFSTLDAMIVDLRLEKCTFIKLGSSVSAIKHKDRTELVSCESLPVGIVQNLHPTIEVKNIRDGDIIVLASDGVVDSFGEVENFKIYINDQKISNLQRFADNVIFELGLCTNKHKDDMSIIALKLLKNSCK